jgi:hypothetical protein
MLKMLAGALSALALVAASLPAAAVETIEPEAVALLKRMHDTVAGAKTLSFTASAVHDVRNAEGQSIFLLDAAQVVMRRPDRLRITVIGDGPSIDAIWTGKTLRAFNPGARLVASHDDASLEGVLKAAAQQAGIAMSVADVILAGSGKPITDGLTSAFVVGQSSLVGGVRTDVVAFAAPDAHGQVWIGAKDGLPRRLLVTHVDEIGQPRNQVDFRNWRIDRKVGDRMFDTSHMDKAKPVALNALKP